MKYFTLREFDSPDEPGSGNKMDMAFLLKLQKAREMANTPFVIVSGYRSPSHNKKVGGVHDSAHTKGMAVDILVTDSKKRHLVLSSLAAAGFNRFGIGKNFIHVDSDEMKASHVIWDYYPKSLLQRLGFGIDVDV